MANFDGYIMIPTSRLIWISILTLLTWLLVQTAAVPAESAIRQSCKVDSIPVQRDFQLDAV